MKNKTLTAIILGISSLVNSSINEKTAYSFESPQKINLENKNQEIYLGIFKTTSYNTAYELHYSNWRLFYEAVKMEGYGIGKDDLLYSANSIKPLKEKSEGKSHNSKCLGHTIHSKCLEIGRSIAVDPKVIPLGAVIQLTFLENNGSECHNAICENFNGVYYASDRGGSVKDHHIDVYAGPELGVVKGRIFYLGSKLPRKAKVYILKNKNIEELLSTKAPKIFYANPKRYRKIASGKI